MESRSMLRVTSALTVVTWAPLLIGMIVVLSPLTTPSTGDTIMSGTVLVIGVTATALASGTLLHNRPFCVGLSFLISILAGMAFGLVGIGLLLYCTIFTLNPSPYTNITAGEWFFGLNNATMAALPICWAFLWRDYRHEVAAKYITKR